jgi:hypothetical protein
VKALDDEAPPPDGAAQALASRETPMIMEQPQIDAIISGFAVAAAAAPAVRRRRPGRLPDCRS